MEVLIVAYKPRLHELQATIDALLTARREGTMLGLRVWHNDGGPHDTAGLVDLYGKARAAGLPVSEGGGRGNLGFGRGVNALLPAVQADFVLLLNQDATPEPGAIHRLLAAARGDSTEVAAWEMRQIPFEHPKDYDPATLDTVWCSAAALLLRTEALRGVGGFEPRFFMYCEDVDLSWRLRCEGWRIRYLPWCPVVHRTYSEAGEIKPLAVTEGCFANLSIRTRYAGRRSVAQGIGKLLRELRGPQPFAGRRSGLLRALLKFAWNYSYFRRTRRSRPGFEPCLPDWDYEMRRTGVFHAFRSSDEWGTVRPAVAVFVGACDAARTPTGALAQIRHQTHRPLLVVTVGMPQHRDADGDCLEGPDVDSVAVDTISTALDLVASKGIRWALAGPSGNTRWYADHVEVLLQTALDRGMAGASSETWQLDVPLARASEGHRLHVHRQVLPTDHPWSLHSALMDLSLFDRQTGQPRQSAFEALARLPRVTTALYGDGG